MAKEQIFNIGDKVSLRTKDKEWEGIVLESYSPEIILLKLISGYNIGIREREILEINLISKSKDSLKKEFDEYKNKDLNNIALIITGGTISSRLDPKTGGVISTDAEEILNIAPEIKEICNIIKIEKPFMKFSENMGPKDWKKLAETTKELLNDDLISGVVITHGTDTLHYTSSALSFMLGKLNKPVALTYSQRSIDRGSTDAHLNLICAAKYAVSDIAEVAVVGHKDLNDEFCLAISGVKVRKMHSSRRDTFRPINTMPLAEISLKEFKILKEFNARENTRKLDCVNSINNNVALVKITPGQDPKVLEYLEKEGYKGIILELFGLGQSPASESEHNWLPTIKRLISKGIIICGVAQTINGSLDPFVYSTGRELEKTGLIFLRDMLSETAFVKLSWILSQKNVVKSAQDIKNKMLENLRGEFSEYSNFEL
jgi:glutamyl-tRNA(Gln) amidotransferase subunit D